MTRWRPILEGDARRAAREATAAIAAALGAHAFELPATKAIDLSEGRAGAAVFLDAYARATGDAAARAAAHRLLDEPSTAWRSSRSSRRSTAASRASPGRTSTSRTSRVTSPRTSIMPWSSCSIARAGSARTTSCAAHQLERFRSGYVDVGLAHGVAGAVAFLADGWSRVGPAGHELLRGALRWLWDQRLPDGEVSQFPTRVAPGEAPSASRAAWCNGDPGVAIALLHGGRVLDDAAWWGRGLEVARHVARRDPQTCLAHDGGFCHGASGLAHVLNRLFHATGDAEVGAAARAWLERLLAMRRPGEGLAGFSARELRAGQVVWAFYPGILYGAAGVGLALLGGWSELEPTWDRALLVDVVAR